MSDSILVLGSGPIRIGQGIEFDYSCVHCVWALEKLGYRALIINNNPETVSTDFDTGDGLYFEPVTHDDVLRVVRSEGCLGVVTQFGGQTAINLAAPLAASGVKVLGTQPEAIAMAEDREQFDELLTSLGIPKPAGRAVRSLAEAKGVAREVGYPVLVRPSFVLGGRAMEIVYSEEQLGGFYAEAEDANPGQPVLVDQYLLGQEAEVDVISDGVDALVPGIMEHIERAGVHSGDSMAVFPPVNLSVAVQELMVDYACRIARALGVKGLMNIQFIIQGEKVFVLEVNPRASRTVPFLSKITGVKMVQVATNCMMGQSLASQGYKSGLWNVSTQDIGTPTLEKAPFYAVKAPVFSFQKLAKVEPSLGPEMKSTGEIMGIDFEYEAALYKALIASGIHFKPGGYVILTVTKDDKDKTVGIARKLLAAGYKLAATPGTHTRLKEEGIESHLVMKIQEGSPSLLELIFNGEASLMINTPTVGEQSTKEAKQMRRACIESGVVCITSIDTAEAVAQALHLFARPELSNCMPYTEYLKQRGSLR
ncbi:MAG: carbamoyl-phosphate synthase large subunit [Armatimonadetes bacterium]|nr:carbamoyl-phosphate synthase large subunit [Armatimonadota bacterium]